MGFGGRRANFLRPRSRPADRRDAGACGGFRRAAGGGHRVYGPGAERRGIAGVGMVGIEDAFVVTPEGGRSITGNHPGLILATAAEPAREVQTPMPLSEFRLTASIVDTNGCRSTTGESRGSSVAWDLRSRLCPARSTKKRARWPVRCPPEHPVLRHPIIHDPAGAVRCCNRCPNPRSSTSTVPAPPATGAIRLPTPMTRDSTAVALTPAGVELAQQDLPLLPLRHLSGRGVRERNRFGLAGNLSLTRS